MPEITGNSEARLALVTGELRAREAGGLVSTLAEDLRRFPDLGGPITAISNTIGERHDEATVGEAPAERDDLTELYGHAGAGQAEAEPVDFLDPREVQDMGILCLNADRPGEALDLLQAYLASTTDSAESGRSRPSSRSPGAASPSRKSGRSGPALARGSTRPIHDPRNRRRKSAAGPFGRLAKKRIFTVSITNQPPRPRPSP
jgi:hypothetical protein